VTLRWGFLSTANIGRRNWDALWRSGSGVVSGVASRDLTRARLFIAECQHSSPFDVPPRAYASYEALIASPDIDALYIPVPTGVRRDWVIRAAQAGKHVLCEKPCAINAADLRDMLAACRVANVVFMDGVMFMHSARLPVLRTLLDDGEAIGRFRRLTTVFSFNASAKFFEEDIRSNSTLEPDGCLGDLGWYCIRLALWAMHGVVPHTVIGHLLEDTGRANDPSSVSVPVTFSGELLFGNGVSSSFYCSFNSGNHQWARLDGDRGSITMDDFVLPSAERTDVSFLHGTCRIHVDERPVRDTTAQDSKLFQTFADLVRHRTGASAWQDIALKTQQVLDAARQSARLGGVAVSPASS